MASKASTKFQDTIKQLPSTVRSKPLATTRVLLFLTIWTLALANVIIVSREFENSLPFVVSPTPVFRRRIGIEDPRRQAMPVILAASIVLITMIPIAVVLPLFGIVTFLSRYVIEGIWSSGASVLLLGGAAALAPNPASPLLPIRLRKDLSSVLALSFIVLLLLTIYNLLVLFRITFLLGKGTPNLMNATIFTIMPTEESPSSESKTKKQSDDKQPENQADIDKLESGSAKSGWDDEENAEPSKIEKRFAKAKSILISPLKQATFRS